MNRACQSRERLKNIGSSYRVGCKIEIRLVNRLCNKNFLGLSAILLLITLLSGISFVPAIYVGATIQLQQPQPQQQTQQQPNQIGVSQIIKQIAEKVAAANPGTNAASVEQVLTELVKQNAQATSEANAIE
jgi:hypothetical protein